MWVPDRNRSHDLPNTGRTLYPLSYENWWRATPFNWGHMWQASCILRWSFFTFIYNRSSNMNYFIYTSRHFTPHGKIWTQSTDLAPNVWLHSSVGRASHRYRGGHGFESCWSLDFFRLLLSNCLNWKFTAMIILHFHLQPQFKCGLFHIYFMSESALSTSSWVVTSE